MALQYSLVCAYFEFSFHPNLQNISERTAVKQNSKKSTLSSLCSRFFNWLAFAFTYIFWLSTSNKFGTLNCSYKSNGSCKIIFHSAYTHRIINNEVVVAFSLISLQFKQMNHRTMQFPKIIIEMVIKVHLSVSK